MGRVYKKIYKICIKAVSLFSIFILGGLTYWAASLTYNFTDIGNEMAIESPDGKPGNWLFAGAVILLLFFAQKILLRGTREKNIKFLRWFTGFILFFMGAFLIHWVKICHSMPVFDQLQVILAAREFRNGNFSQMKTYMYMYPHQYGLTFFYEILLQIWDNYRLFQYLNVFFILIIIAFSCMIADTLFENEKVDFYCLLGCVFYLPMHFYVNFIYGELGSIAMSLVALWCVLKWTKCEKMRYVAAALAAASAAVLIRKNSLIILLAVFIILILHGILKKKWKMACLALLILAVPLGSIKAVQFCYEVRSGNQIGEGIPAILWIAMGMQDSYEGSGIYNAYNDMVFWNKAKGDSEIAAQIGKDYIEGRTKEFLANPSMARDFYRSKILEQWNEVSFGSLLMTNHFALEPEGIAYEVYFGDLQDTVFHFMNLYLFLLYLGAFVFAVRLLFGKEEDIRCCCGLIAVIGGFLFSILWEAKSRYVLAYAVILIPYMAYGIFALQDAVRRIIRKGNDRPNGQV